MKTALTLLVTYLLNKVGTVEATDSPRMTRFDSVKNRTQEMGYSIWNRMSQTKESIQDMMRAQEERIFKLSMNYGESVELFPRKTVKLDTDKAKSEFRQVQSEFSVRNGWNNFLEFKSTDVLSVDLDCYQTIMFDFEKLLKLVFEEIFEKDRG